jgi:hypothetical protein
MESPIPNSIEAGPQVFKFDSIVQQWTRMLQELGTTPVSAFFNTNTGKWAARRDKENIPMPRPGSIVSVEGFLTGIERPEDDSMPFTHLDVAIDNIYFPSSARSPAPKKPFSKS